MGIIGVPAVLLKHEHVHLQQIKNAMDAIYKDLTSVGTGPYTRAECNEKQKEASQKKTDAKGTWDIMIMNGDAHSGPEWDEWKKNGGKTEMSPELW